MDGLKPPKQLNLEGDISGNWRRWKQQFYLYLVASGGTNQKEEVKVATFLHVIGPEALEKYNTFNITQEESKDLNSVIDAFEQYCVPKSNETVNRHLFFTRVQREGESFDTFLTDVKRLSADCGFEALRDSLIRDRLICGIRNKSLKDRLLRETNLDLDKCVKMCKMTELANDQLKMLEEDKMINEIKTSMENPKFKSSDKYNKQTKYTREQTGWRDYKNVTQRKCERCGYEHQKLKCPAIGKECTVCHKRNHFAKMCKTKLLHMVNEEPEIDGEMQDTVIQTLYLDTVSTVSSKQNEWFEKIKLDNNNIMYAKLDTGAQCNAMPIKKFKTLNLNNKIIYKPKINLKNYNGTKIKVLGKCEIPCYFQSKIKQTIEFYLIDSDIQTPIVLGLPTINDLGLIQRIASISTNYETIKQILEKNKHLFQGIGEITNYTYNIQLKPNAVGKVEAPRKVPLKVQDFLKEELKTLLQKGIIKKVEGPTEWVNSLVVVKKANKSLRMCLDPQYLNKQIEREHYILPTFEEIASRIKDAHIYTTLDANKAFWQIKLSDTSAKYTTFNTPYGRYCFQRLPYGLCSAPEVFHKCFSQMFEDIEGVEIYIDDILIWGKNEKEHNDRLRRVLSRAEERGIKFNKEKCKIGATQVKYLGHILTPNGILPNPEKVQAIVNIKNPKNKMELEKFLGMITYVSKFIPNVSQLTTQLRELLKKSTEWHWNEEHTKSFEQLKSILTKAPVLQYFDENSTITLSVDASKDGLGAVLLQNGLPVTYASKALTQTQKDYAQIEKEMLAIQFGCERFHQYIYGRAVRVESDHKPLEYIFQKPLNKCPLRLQCMRIRLQPYDITVSYKPGKMLLLADALSRTTNKGSTETVDTEQTKDVEAYVGSIIQDMPISDKKFEQFREETNKDRELLTIMKLVKEGWPQKKSEVPDEAKPYHNFEADLTVVQGLLLKNESIVVPKSLRKEILQKVHYNHLGINKCKNRARGVIFWPQMNKEIEDLVSNCNVCLRYQRKHKKQPMIERELPHGPWQRLGMDIFYYKGKDFLLVVDMYSKFVDVEKLNDMLSLTTIKAIKTMISRYGIPKLIYSDNGPQFNNINFQKFTKELGIEHRTSSPRYPQSNGLAERYIQTVKNMWRKADFEDKDPYLVMLEYNATPIADNMQSPSELMFGRKTRGLLPTMDQFITRDSMDEHRSKLKQRQINQKKFYNRATKDLEQLKPDDNVFAAIDNNKNTLIEARVLAHNTKPRSYNLLTQNGTIVGRNRRDIYTNTSKLPMEIERDLDEYKEMSEPPIMTQDVKIKTSVNDVEQTTSQPAKIQPEITELDKKPEPIATNQTAAVVPKVTRSGRIIKQPLYLKDYVT